MRTLVEDVAVGEVVSRAGCSWFRATLVVEELCELRSRPTKRQHYECGAHKDLYVQETLMCSMLSLYLLGQYASSP